MLLAAAPITEAPLKFVGHAKAQLPVPSCVMMKVIISPAVGLVTELEVTFPVKVRVKLVPALASNTCVAAKLCTTCGGKSAGTIRRAVIGPAELPVAGPTRNAWAA